MRVLTSVLAVGTITLGLSVGPVLAATPHADSTYKGSTTEGSDSGKITIKAKSSTELALVKHVDSCGEVYKVRSVKVKADGTFKGEIRLEHLGDVVIWTVTGKFVKGGTKAKGSTTQVACSGAKAPFTAIEK